MSDMKKAIVLFSGGLDSRTVLAMAQDQGFEPIALSFLYGQRHSVELERALEVTQGLKIPHRMQRIDLRSAGGSALTSDDIEVPTEREVDEMSDSIPVTYVPARNTILLSFALSWAEVEGATDIFHGANVLDYSGYPDCRPEYIKAFEDMANLALKSTTEDGNTMRIHTPLIDLSKVEIIQAGHDLGVDYGETWSCYNPIEQGESVVACGECDSCILRRKGFEEAGIPDPTIYAEEN